MGEKNDIHYLVQELIPVMNDISKEAQQIVINHVANCESCRKLYEASDEFERELPEYAASLNTEVKPLKKLVQFNWGIRMLLIAVRVGILAYIIFSGISFGRAFPDSTLTYIQGSLYIFYAPAAVFLLAFTFVFSSKKWLYCTLAVDILVVFALKVIWELFIF